jgi:hypothetical protein
MSLRRIGGAILGCLPSSRPGLPDVARAHAYAERAFEFAQRGDERERPARA